MNQYLSVALVIWYEFRVSEVKDTGDNLEDLRLFRLADFYDFHGLLDYSELLGVVVALVCWGALKTIKLFEIK